MKPLMEGRSGRLRKSDEELRSFLEHRKNVIKVLGCGGAGNNAVTRLFSEGIEGALTVAVNADAQDLLYSEADKKVLIGKELTKGLGAGGDPKIGNEAARESIEDIKAVLEGTDMVFVTCGLGGGTGTGSAPIIAGLAKRMGILSVGIVTLPFSVEGRVRMENALKGLGELRNIVDTLLIIPNDRILQIVPNVSINTAFKLVDDVLVNSVKGIVELITKAGLVNMDFADVKAVMSNGGLAMIGIGESNANGRAIESVTKALNHPFLPVDITGAKGALINIIGSNNMTLDEAKDIVEVVSTKLQDNAQIVWGAQVERNMKETIRTMVIITGVKETIAYEHLISDGKNIEKEHLKKVLGIDFVEK